MLAKIKALLSKTVESGATEEEAMAAMQKAMELMDKYKIDAGQLEDADDDEDFVFFNWAGTTYQEKMVLGQIRRGIEAVAKVKAWRHRENRRDHDWTFRCFGFEGDVMFAEWLARTLTGFVVRSASAFPAGNTMEMDGFIMGMATRINDRMLEADAKRERPSTGTDIVPMDYHKLLLDELKAEHGITFHSAPIMGVRMDRLAYEAGQAAGNTARWDRPVQGKEASVLGIAHKK